MRTQNAAYVKAKGFYFIGAVMALSFSGALHAQNTSYSANTIPISGSDNCAFGQGALSSNTTGFYNVATGMSALRSNTTGGRNTGIGFYSLYSNSTGYNNVAVGAYAMRFNTTGFYNVAVGLDALTSNTTGSANVAIGTDALRSNTTASYNVANGSGALYANTTGSNNAATGYRALYANTTGNYNTANGYIALTANTTGNWNMADGYQALYSNTTGSENAGAGSNALRSNTTGSYNTGMGTNALYYNTTGIKNTATGYRALFSNATGYDNTADGFQALYSNTTGNYNAAAGHLALWANTTGSCNTGIGTRADVSTGTLNNATAIGCDAIVNASNKVRIGNANVTVVEGPVAYTVSDGRFKSAVKEEDVKGLEFIQKLRPVVYNFDTKKLTEFWTKNMPDSIRRSHLDKDFTASTAIRQSGFIAQEVEQAAKDVNYDFNGVHVPENESDNYSLAYAQFVVPLVKAVQEQQQMIADQQQLNVMQQQRIEALEQQINEFKKQGTTGISNISSPLEGASMEQNVPNPFSRETVVKFNLPQQIGSAYMMVYDLTGREVKSFPIYERGASSITITADQLEAGMYIYSITADGSIVDSKRMVVAGK